MKVKKIDVIIYLILSALAIRIFWVYPNLPADIPTHWNLQGEIDGWGNKGIIWAMYGLVWLTHLIFYLSLRIGTKKEKYKKFGRVYDIFHIIMVIFTAGLVELTIKFSFAPSGASMGRIMPIMMSVFTIITGNYLPKCRHNYILGVRTPWTLASEEVWNRTHRFAGIIWVIMGGISLVVCIMASGGKITIAISFTFIIIAAVIPIIYSYIVFKEEKKG